MDASTVRRILQGLARRTRVLPRDFGPITLADIFNQFRSVLQAEPTAESSQILHRLPGLGLVETGSSDRQFVDRFLLDGLRADDVRDIVLNKEYDVCGAVWLNPLGLFGQMLCMFTIFSDGLGAYMAFAKRAAAQRNAVLALDIAGSIIHMRGPSGSIDFDGIHINGGSIAILDLGVTVVSGLKISDCEVGMLLIDNDIVQNVELDSCGFYRVEGVASANALPSWCVNCEGDVFQALSTTRRIRESHISVQHQILLVIIRKTFFQKGSGRKEAALLRGLGQIDRRDYRKKILKLLLREKILRSHRGDDGLVYHPVSSHRSRMSRMLEELNHSSDEIWRRVGEL